MDVTPVWRYAAPMTACPAGALSAPATARNRAPLLAVLAPRLPVQGLVLEIAAGAGEHAAYNAAALPGVQWQPTDPDEAALASIAAWRAHVALPNLLAPLRLDAASADWPIAAADAIVNINMIHISPWAATQGLLAGAARLLPPGAKLFLYGPYIENGVATAASNLAFNESLRARDPAWGIRHLDEVTACAAAQGLRLAERIAMPAENLVVIFQQAAN